MSVLDRARVFIPCQVLFPFAAFRQPKLHVDLIPSSINLSLFITDI